MNRTRILLVTHTRYVASLCLGLVIAVGFSAEAASGESSYPPSDVIGLSPDGVAYARSYSELFDGQILVPHEKAVGTFVVQNDSDATGYLHIRMTAVDIPDGDVLDALTMTVSTPEEVGEPRRLSDADPCLVLLEALPLAPREGVSVQSVLALGGLTATRGQHVPIGFALQVLLSDRPGTDDDDCRTVQSSPAPPTDDIAATGFAGIGIPVAGAAGLIVAGGVLVAWFRRRRDKTPTAVSSDD
jgi:hypothetical protein